MDWVDVECTKSEIYELDGCGINKCEIYKLGGCRM